MLGIYHHDIYVDDKRAATINVWEPSRDGYVTPDKIVTVDFDVGDNFDKEDLTISELVDVHAAIHAHLLIVQQRLVIEVGDDEGVTKVTMKD